MHANLPYRRGAAVLGDIGLGHRDGLLQFIHGPVFDLAITKSDPAYTVGECIAQRLQLLIREGKCLRLLYAQHIVQDGKRFFEEICSRDLEGVVAKHRNGVYKDDGIDWLKMKNPHYSQAEGRHELLTRRRVHP